MRRIGRRVRGRGGSERVDGGFGVVHGVVVITVGSTVDQATRFVIVVL